MNIKEIEKLMRAGKGIAMAGTAEEVEEFKAGVSASVLDDESSKAVSDSLYDCLSRKTGLPKKAVDCGEYNPARVGEILNDSRIFMFAHFLYEPFGRRGHEAPVCPVYAIHSKDGFVELYKRRGKVKIVRIG